ncbi:response regulator transcription factor [Paenibacillus sp.]|uniref:response regulator transcription factor n=1 Tax=Paenibacillus sp. TaxID=58172 RepID=UPI0028127B6B|nr:response regulator transcription factor [Paenibacillus sp.]
MLKEVDGAELLQSIRMVGSGHAVFGAEVATRLAGLFERKPEPFAGLLTGREREVLRCLAAGDGNAAIAVRLHLSVKTVANHVANILNKLQVSDRSEARRLAQSYGAECNADS